MMIAMVQRSRILPVGLLVGILATLGLGVARATTATVTSGANACVNSQGTLRLLSFTGRCPFGYHEVTLGLAGQSDTYSVASGAPTATPAIDVLALPAGSYVLTLSYEWVDNEPTPTFGDTSIAKCVLSGPSGQLITAAVSGEVLATGASALFAANPSESRTVTLAAPTTLTTACTAPVLFDQAAGHDVATVGQYESVNVVATQVATLHSE